MNEAAQAEPAAARPAIALDGLVREFGDRVALDGISLTLARGDTLAVLGPNGAGKSTLLRVLSTLLRPSAGTVSVLGCELPGEGWRLRGRIGYLGHEPLLYRDLSGRENLRFSARLHGLEAGESERRIAELLERVGMEHRADERVEALSAGMRQRLAVCRAVLHDPGLLLLDEPGAHLDPEGRRLAGPLIASGEGRSRVVVTHDATGALRQAGRVLALDHRGAAAYEGASTGVSAERLRAVYSGSPV